MSDGTTIAVHLWNFDSTWCQSCEESDSFTI